MAKKTVKQNAIAAALSAYDTFASMIKPAPAVSNKGRFPHAVLHKYKTEGLVPATDYAKLFSGMTINEAVQYVWDCVKTNGQPHLIDLFEREEAEKASRRQRQQFQNVDMEGLETELDKISKRQKRPVTSLLGQTGLEL